MASGTASQHDVTSGTVVEYDRFVDMQLRKTRGYVRGVDLATGLMTTAAGSLIWLLVAAVTDHWLVRGGMGTWGRAFFFLTLVGVGGYYVATRVLPLVLRRINPVYLAEQIERGRPSLKNSLINFLLFRRERERMPEVVYRAVEEQAATTLAEVEIDSAVDRSQLIRIGYVLVAVMAIGAVYKMTSPKDPLTSVGRVILPWRNIAPPTQVRVFDISPGSCEVFRGEPLTVAADVRGLGRDEPVTLYYSTADGQVANKPLGMHLPSDGFRFQCQLPPGDGGVQQSLTYRIVAGDCTTETFQVRVVAAPTIVVRSVHYEYPAYTALPTRRVEHLGDIKALEGTQVTIRGQANHPLKSAEIDFECDGHGERPLQVRESEATGTFTLRLQADRQTPEHRSYQLLITTADGHRNTQPIRHEIEVTPDLAPEVQLLAPRQERIEVPLDGAVEIEVTASDPDFALRRVEWLASRRGTIVDSRKLVDEPWRGQFTGKLRFEPRKAQLSPGDTIDYWAAADDNKLPAPNHVETARRQIVILAPAEKQRDPQQGPQDQQPPNGRPKPQENRGPQGAQNPPADKPAEDQPQPGQKNGPDDKPQEQGQNPQRGPQEGQQQGPQDKQQKPGAGGKGPQQPGQDPQAPANELPQPGQQQPQAGGQQGGDKSQQPKGGQQQPGGESQQGGGAGDKSQPVAKDGSDDGSAFEQALKHLQKQEPKNQPGDKQPQDKPQEGNQGQQKPGGDKTQKPQENPGQPGGGKQPDKQQPGQQNGPGDPKEKPPGGGDKQERGGGQPDKKDGLQPGADNKPGDRTQNGPGKAPQPGQGQNAPQPGEKPADQGGQGPGSGKPEKPNAGGKPEESGQRAQPGEKGDPAGRQEKPQGAEPGAAKPEGARPGEPNGQPGQQGKPSQGQPGQGAQSKGPGDPAQKPSQQAPMPDAKGGDPENQKGEAGKGQSGGNERGNASPQEANRQRNLTPQQGPNASHPQQQEPGSPSNSKSQSNSQGDSQGDRSGGGKPGGGQKANKPGTGDAGQNTASDEGAGQSKDRGKGDTSGKPGGDQQAGGATGQAGNQRGAGSSAKPGEGGAPGGQPGGGQSGAGQSGGQGKNDQPGDAAQRPQQPTQGGGGSGPTGGSRRDGDTPLGRTGQTIDDAADKANLDYSRKATDLVLDRLKDQLERGQPDQELLDKLGWTRDDLAAFVARWEKMRAEAKSAAPKAEPAKRELDEALRSLGLRPRDTALGADRAREDQLRGLKESRRTSPPAEYAEQLKAYTQGTARGVK